MEKANVWGGSKKHDEPSELLLDLLFGSMEAEGYNIKEFGRIPLYTTAYGGIRAEINGKSFDVTVSECDKHGN